MRHIRLIAATAAALLLATFASAQNWFFTDPVNQGQEVPPSGSTGSGSATGNYNDTTNVLNIFVTAAAFTYQPTLAHIHGPAPPGVSTGIVFTLGVAGGLNNYTNPNTQFNLSASQETDFLNGLYYVNIHSAVYGDGAIRGQLNPVPEPASLFALAAGSALLLRRRNRLKR